MLMDPSDRRRSLFIMLALAALGVLAVAALVAGLVIVNIDSGALDGGRPGVEDCRG